MQQPDSDLSFEEAYSRLEAILEKMNSGRLALEESLKLYEEADRLIAKCSKKLTSAEQKIETLIKQRSGELALDSQGLPEKQGFN
jgi:exodeoxyribonuclease VII small subunit